jgi:hypothetical protein
MFLLIGNYGFNYAVKIELLKLHLRPALCSEEKNDISLLLNNMEFVHKQL